MLSHGEAGEMPCAWSQQLLVAAVVIEASAPKVYPRVTLARASTLSGKDLDVR